MSEIRKKPALASVLGEALLGFEAASLPLALLRAKSIGQRPISRRPVMVVPGYMTGDRSTAALRAYLNRCGYKTEGWGLGLNKGGRGLIKDVSELSDRWVFDRSLANVVDVEIPALCELFFKRIEERSDALGEPLSLVGWSLGGYLSREAAREYPERVAQVITLGSPINGGAKYTSIAPLFKFRGANLPLIDQAIRERDSNPIRVPMTSIYGTRDGIVSDFAAIDTVSPNVRNVRVAASHFGMGFNAGVLKLIQETLEAADNAPSSMH